MSETATVDTLDMPHACGIMLRVSASEAAKARTARASRNYVRLRDQFAEARKELAAAVVAERAEGEKIEDITERVPVRQATVNRFLEAAGVTEKRTSREDRALRETRRTLENMGTEVRELGSARPKFMQEPPGSPDGT